MSGGVEDLEDQFVVETEFGGESSEAEEQEVPSRKRTREEESSEGKSVVVTKKKNKFAKLKAKRKAFREAELKQAQASDNTEIDLRLTEVRALSTEAQHAMFWNLFCEYCPSLSPIEMKDGLGRLRFVSSGTSQFQEPQHIDQAHAHIRKLWKPTRAGAKLENGSSCFVLISPSAIRANQFAKSLRRIALNTRVLKLFGKHMKLQEQIDMIQSVDIKSQFGAENKARTKQRRTQEGKLMTGNYQKGDPSSASTVILVSTPGRLLKLAQSGSISFHRTQMIVIDAARNEKSLSLFSNKEICGDFFRLYQKHIHPVALSNEIQMCFY